MLPDELLGNALEERVSGSSIHSSFVGGCPPKVNRPSLHGSHVFHGPVHVHAVRTSAYLTSYGEAKDAWRLQRWRNEGPERRYRFTAAPRLANGIARDDQTRNRLLAMPLRS